MTGLLVMLTALGAALCSSAIAQPRTAVVKPPMKIHVCGGGGEVELKLHHDFITSIEAPSPVRAYAADSDRITYWNKDQLLLRMRPSPLAKPGDVTSVEIVLGKERITFKVRVVADPDAVELRWVLIAGAELCAQPVFGPWKVIAKYAMRHLLSHVRDYFFGKGGRANAVTVSSYARQTMRATKMRDIPSWREWDLIAEKEIALDGTLHVRFVCGRWRGVDLEFLALVHNPEPQPYPVQHALLTAGRVAELQDIEVLWDTLSILQDDGMFVIPAGARVPVLVKVPNVASAGRDITPMTLNLLGAAGDASGTQVARFRVLDKEYTPEVIDKMWDAQMRRERRDAEAEGRISLMVVGMLGGAWLENPFDTADSGAAAIKGIGFRARYGINRYFSFEGEIGASWTGAVRFEDAMQGEVTRSAWLGRTQVEALVMLGEEIIPTIRLGVGLQGVSHSAEFSAMPERELDSSLELLAMWQFGVGLEWRATQHLRLGADMNVLIEAARFTGNGTRGLLLLGGYVGYSWQP